ncbi:E3 ubiquitin-protein ligase TRIM63-like [Mercenaria mercenaria]|uniref:E3 ubiquitin-protein ligase TRIM63-like n=1 Tax=Mercenaria mercenaria TaxID=6596 RepID=UPI00234EF99F|nr:E3 ubiquitin-protein ligase TRIM63-like [Mercenaria mercenaria]
MTMAASQQVVKPVQSAQEMTETNAVTTDLVTTESEEVFEMYCEPCNREGTSVTATAFCPSCVDYLCATCLKYHKRFLSEHAYLDNDKMSRDICLEKCPTHKNEIIKFYCATCKTFACSVCKKKDHNVSCRLKYLSDLVNDLEIESGLKKLISKSDDVVRSVSKTEQLIMKTHEIISDIPRKAKTTLKNETEAMFSFFYKEMQNIEEKIQSEKKLDNGRIEGVTQKYNLLKLDIDKLSDTHKQSSKSDSNQKYTHFMKLTTFSQELEGMVVSLQGVSKQCTLSGDKLKSSVKKQVNELNERVKTIGIGVRKFGTESKRTHEKVQRKVATEVTTIYVKNENDKYDCWISKCFLLSDQILFVSDANNSSVKLFDTRNQNLLCIRPVNTPPCAATKVTDTQIAIVQNHEHYKKGSVIQFLTLTKAKILFFQKSVVYKQK